MKANEFLEYKNWVVVGDVLNRLKYAYKILSSLKEGGFNVVGLNPSVINDEAYKRLSDVPYKIEILNLCINPDKGIKILQEAHQLKIDKILIQPGAESAEILDFCRINGIQAVEGCTLVELRKR
ncbi:CoA-binding protein [Clostridium estertheticum]|uniref:CoA-binding protein n=1 Tax=Clostridium estertheticum TaxID=238834 RepID=UPI0013E8FA74|nr:CoA-binding protein [Clostridium estertheticum]MBZ9687854.1 CoA-binding protein [Clostridium estertheticum]